MMPRASRSGFALLLTLVLLVLAGIALAGLARWSMLGAVEARDATEEVQRRWAIASCQAYLLPRINDILEEDRLRNTNGREAISSPELRVDCELSNLKMQLVFTDEQAKLNAGSLLEKSNLEKTGKALLQVLPPGKAGEGPSMLAIRPLPRRADVQDFASLPRLASYGQLFDRATPGELLGTKQTPGLIQAITCWGDGRINIHRAPASVIQLVCADVLRRDQMAALIRQRNDAPTMKLAALLDRQANIDDKQRARLAALFTDDSRCGGLWIVVQGSQRSWFILAVVEGLQPAKTAATRTSTPGQPHIPTVDRRHDFIW